VIRALLWKEAREQGLIVGALAVLGVAVLLAVGMLGGGREFLDSRTVLTDPGILATIMLTMTGGAVVGGTLFAAEKENGTDVLLALLPVRRRGVWAGKMLAGAALVMGVTVVLVAAAAAVRLLGQAEYLPLWAVGLPVLALATFAWGSVGSVLARSSLAAAGLGVAFMALSVLVILPVGAGIYYAVIPRVSGWLPNGGRGAEVVAIFSGVLFTVLVLPAGLSLRLYTAPDRDRHRRAVRGTGESRSGSSRRGSSWLGRLTAGFRAAVWMNVRQQRRFAVVVSLIGLVSGLSVLSPAVPVVAVWPPVGLFLAVLLGVLGWYDEQSSGAKRFWLERRLPVGVLWAAKVLVGSAGCLLMTLLTLAPVLLKMWVTRRDLDARPSFLLGEPDFPVFTFVLLWPASGFAFGHLVGMLFRKAIVAASVAVMVAAVAAAVWLPSLLGGGLHPWQVWLPLAVTLAVARVMAWACVADRVGTSRAIGRLTLGGLAVSAAVGVGLGYRVAEIPDDPARGRDVAFEREQIPPFDVNLAGQEYRRAGSLLHEAVYGPNAMNEQLARRVVTTPAQAARESDPVERLPKQLSTLLVTTLEHGWQPTEEAEGVLAYAFRTEWAGSVEAAARLPVGTIEDPRDLTLNAPMRNLHMLNGADALLLVRGLKAQHDGDPERFVADFALVLNLSRNTRNKSVQGCALAGRRAERRAVTALQRWLERLRGREDLLAKVEAELAAHDAACGNDLASVRLADQVVLRNTIARSGEVLRRQWRSADVGDDARQRMDVEADLVGIGWQMPWEVERHERLIARGNAAGYGFQSPNSPFAGMPGVSWWPHNTSVWLDTPRGGFAEAEALVQADRRAARLLVAIRRFEMTHPNPPKSLADLVPEFLPAVPLDPFDRTPFRSRPSAGELIPRETRTPAPRTTTLWPHEMQLAAAVGGWVGVVKETQGVVGGGVAAPTEANRGTEFASLLGGLCEADGRFAYPEQLLDKATRGVVEVNKGRLVIWSVGPDTVDQLGLEIDTRPGARDLVYIPPPIPAENRR
jgi:ABC-type transport system involved in multi-copper enzyme maturation permease subunit